MKLLVIDDNQALVRSLKDFLDKTIVVSSAATAKEGLWRACTEECDIIVLDVMLPDGLGTDVCREIRAADITTPIIALSGVTDVKTRVELLNIGADDYLMKPFSLLELRARIFAQLRRTSNNGTNGTLLTAGDLTLDLASRHVQRAGKEINLRRKEFDILAYLLRNQGQVVTRSMIFDHVWESDKDYWHNTIDVHIKRLRDKIDRPFKEPLIRTAYGVGYVLSEHKQYIN